MNTPGQDRIRDEMADIDLKRPTVPDVEQDVYVHPAVPVRVADPVQVQQLPTISGHPRSHELDAITPIKILNDDARRATAHVVAATNAVILGTDKSEVAAGHGFRLPVDVLFPIRSTERWYAIAVTATATLSVCNEQWAE
jgi:hypothetical protein